MVVFMTILLAGSARRFSKPAKQYKDQQDNDLNTRSTAK